MGHTAKNYKIYFYCRYLIIPFTIVFIFSGFKSETSWNIKNPYEHVDWANDGRYKGNFHTHTALSDGLMNPQTVVEEYHKLGYTILAITDHNQITYPWTNFSKMEPTGRYKILKQNELKKGLIGPEDLIFEDRNPQDLGMVSVTGNELTHHNHMISLFSNYDAGEQSHSGTGREEASLKGNSLDQGLAFWAHPMGDQQRDKVAQLAKDTVGWFVDLYNQYDNLIGQEINNRRDDYVIWDSVLTRMMPGKAVWGFANDDMHSLGGLGYKWNTLVLPELSKGWVRRGMTEGRFFFVHSPKGHDGPAPPVIDSISVDEKSGTIHIHATGDKSVEWIFNGSVVHNGNNLDLNNLSESKGYVRAVVYGDSGTYTGTQPFGIDQASGDVSASTPILSQHGDGVTDVDGNVYKTIVIGDQEWMAENLRVSHYQDGTPIEIPGEDISAWAKNKSSAAAWYNNDPDNFKNAYGALYNWYAVSNEAKLCPEGWRIPTDEDWKKLEIYLGMNTDEANSAGYRGKDDNIAFKLMSGRVSPDDHPRWDDLLSGGTNISGFSALPAGYRSSSWATFSNVGRTGYWWTSTERNSTVVWTRKIEHNFPEITRFALGKKHGFSVRCIKDN